MQSPVMRRELISYGMLALPIAFAGVPLYIYAPDFYSTQFPISLSLLAAILLGVRCFDAVQDPLIGYLSDRFHSHRLTIMLVASVALVSGFAALFHPPAQYGLLWFALSMMLATTAFSVLSINLNTLGGLWHRQAHEKTRIAGYREMLGVIGLLIAVLTPAVLMRHMPAADAFTWMSAILGLLIVIAAWWFYGWYRTHVTESNTQRNGNVITFHGWKTMMKSHRSFWGVYMISMLASSIPALLVLAFIRDRLQAEINTGAFLAAYFISAACAMPLWYHVSRRYNKHRAWMAGMALAIAGFVWAYFLEAGDIWQYAVICVMSGLALGADLVLPPSILADIIQQEHTEQHASLQFSVLAFLSKLALALASATVFPLLDAYGYKPGDFNAPDALKMISISYALIPCFIKAAAIIWLWRVYRHDKGDYHADPIHPHSDRSIINAE